MGGWSDQRTRFLTRAPLEQLRKIVEGRLDEEYLHPLETDELDDDDENIWISWGKVEGYSVAEFDARSIEAERLLFGNSQKISINLSGRLFVIHEGSSSLIYREFEAGKTVLSWSEMMGAEDGVDEDFNWLDDFCEQFANDENEAYESDKPFDREFLEDLLKNRLGFSRSLRQGVEVDYIASCWVENEAETVWYGDETV